MLGVGGWVEIMLLPCPMVITGKKGQDGSSLNSGIYSDSEVQEPALGAQKLKELA